MQGKIAFEEHMAIPETVSETRSFAGDSGRWDDFTRQILMSAPAAWATWTKRASSSRFCPSMRPGSRGSSTTGRGHRSGQEGQRRHRRGHGPVSRPLRRNGRAAHAGSGRGFRGIDSLHHGSGLQGRNRERIHPRRISPDSAIYYDIPEYRPFWATVSELDVPFYLHPRMQIPSRAQNYEGHPLGS